MSTVLSSTAFDPSIKEEISSWIQNEQQCVTAHRIAQTHSISRAEASRLLQEIVQDSPKQFPCQITMVVQERKQQQHKSSSNTDNLTTNKTVFRLSTSAKIPDSIAGGTTVFAVAPAPGTDNDHSPEQVSTAHERDMVTLREMVQEGRYSSTMMLTSSNKKRSVASISTIDPAEGLLEWLDHKATTVTAGKSHEEEPDENEVKFAPTKFVGRSSRPVGKKTATTAASFFAAHTKKATNPTNNKANNGGTSHENKAPAAKATGTTSSNHKTSTKSTTTSPSATSSSTTANKTLSASSLSMTTSSKPNPDRQEKENKINSRPSHTTSNTTSAKVGNADDFVGDMEEEDDDEEIEIVPPPITKAAAATTKKQPPHDDTIDVDNPANDGGNEDNDEEDDPQDKKGSKSTNTSRSTTFTPTDFSDPNRKRKRRKKLVEKTTMQNGYLHTETQSIWEDVPTDEEEEEEKAAIARQRAIPQHYTNNTAAKGESAANTKKSGGAKANTNKHNNNKNDSMKQKSLMGFFAKK